MDVRYVALCGPLGDTTMSQEMRRSVGAFGYGWSDLARFTINAMKSAFIPFAVLIG